MARLPEGAPAPPGGELPRRAVATLPGRPLGLYVHVPFCAARCGYCDFNTYTPSEDGGGAYAAYVRAARAEIALARRVLGDGAPPASTVFFGGGTPTLLPPADLATLLADVRGAFGLARGAEVTVEANPETVGEATFAQLRAAGFTRVSIGMQSAHAHVLEALDRRHAPGAVEAAVRAARAAGFEQVSLDLIFGAAGESDDDWRSTLAQAIALRPDHVAAYSLTVEPGTRLHARVRRGDVAPPAEEALERRYRIADEALSASGLPWYEVSNWARGPAARSRHNAGYWGSANWWGVGPGAHSHVGGVRWWNVLHPRAYAARLAARASPAAGRELLTADQRRLERVLLELRTAEGLGTAGLGDRGARSAREHAERGRLDGDALARGRAVLTLDGRLLADAVALDLAA